MDGSLRRDVLNLYKFKQLLQLALYCNMHIYNLYIYKAYNVLHI